jgi:hypothetical protein
MKNWITAKRSQAADLAALGKSSVGIGSTGSGLWD